MKRQTAERWVEVVNPLGLHLRPADLLVRTANRFDSAIQIVKDGEPVDGKSILSVMALAAERGTRLTIIATGDDAEEAVEALVGLFERGFDEIEPSTKSNHSSPPAS